MQGTAGSDLSTAVSLASQENCVEGNLRLFRALEDREVFYAVQLVTHIDPGTGQTRETISALPLIVLPSGQKALRMFVDSKDGRLQKPFGGAVWQRAIDIFRKSPEADGLLITNPNRDVVAWDRKAVERMAGDAWGNHATKTDQPRRQANDR